MQRQFKITVNGVDYQVAVVELGGQPASSNHVAANVPAPSAPSAPAVVEYAAAQQIPETPAVDAGHDELAQMGGVVAHIYVKEGQLIAEGERILDLEAMKMKVPLVASRAGKVLRILVAEGDAVDGGQALICIA